MNEKTRKYMELLEELVTLVGEEKKTGRDDDIDLRITQMTRELRQMIERMRRIKDGDGLTYEPVAQEAPRI